MEQRLVFFDLETCGVDPSRHPIIQIGAMAVNESLEVIEEYEAKVKFDSRKADPNSLRKNHYHPGIWAQQARPPTEVAKTFAEFLRRHSSYPALSAQGRSFHVAQLVAHNAAFDGQFLISWYETLGVYLPAKRPVFCTMQLAMWHCLTNESKQPSNYQLATLCEFFGVPFHAATAHDALGDVSATVGLFHAIAWASNSTRNMAA